MNRKILIKDCEDTMYKNTTSMVRACLQPLVVETKGEVLGTIATLKLGLTQGVLLSPILFLIYINYLTSFCPRGAKEKVSTNYLERAKITMTADDVAFQTHTWHHLQLWMDACGLWACKKKMHCESAKCTKVCNSLNERNDPKILLHISGGIKKELSSTYLVMILTGK